MSSPVAGSGNMSTLTGALVCAGAAIAIVATSKMLQYVRNSAAANTGAEITGTAPRPPIHHVQMNEINPSANSGSTDGTTVNGIAAVPTRADNEEQVQVVIEMPPSSSGQSTDAQNAMADVLTTTYSMLADIVFNTIASGAF